MKKLLAAASFAALIAASPALADNTDTKTVTVAGTIVAPLTITSAGTLTMPHLVRPEGAEPNTTVSVGCGATDATNVVIYGGQGNPFANGTASATTVSVSSANGGIAGVNKTGTCADVVVTGEPNYYFQYTATNIVQPSTGGVTISAPVCTNAGAAIAPNVQLAGGTATIRCGASVAATSSAISYADGKFDVTVTYD